MAKWNMSDESCKLAEQMGFDCASGWEAGVPLHVVRECLIRGFDKRTAELLESGDE